MINRLIRNIRYFKDMQRITMALARGGATAQLRVIKEECPISWEFSGFSQNGEDGIIDFLTQKIKHPNRYLIEIGSSYGTENNTTWLAVAKKFNGLMIEGSAKASARSREVFFYINFGVECINMFITRKNVESIKKLAIYTDPDVFSLDIDGNDYYVAHSIMELQFRPKILVVEYNSAYGPIQSKTIKYQDNFSILNASESQLYYGVSITGWRNLFEKYGYKFVTVNTSGVNAFFVNQEDFDKAFIDKLNALQFQENFYQMKKFKFSWEKQFEMIKHMDFMEIK